MSGRATLRATAAQRVSRGLVRGGEFVRTAWRDNVFFLASALSFDALLAAIPLILLFLSVLGYVANAQAEVANAFRSAVQLMLPAHPTGSNDPLTQAERLITQVIGSRQAFSLFGIPLFLLFSTRLFSSARIALDQVLAIESRRQFRHDLLHDLMLVVLTTVLFVANALISIPASHFTLLNRIAAHSIALLFGTLLFFVVYSLAPTRKPRWDTALIAAIAAGITFEVSKVLYGVYLSRYVTFNRIISNTNAIAVFLFVLWIYLIAMVFLLGAQVAKAHQARLGGKRPLMSKETSRRYDG